MSILSKLFGSKKPEKDLIMQIAVNDPQTTSLKVYVNGLYYDTFALSSGSV